MGEVFPDGSTTLYPEMMVVPGGHYLIGSPASEIGRKANEGPQRDVTIRAFALGKFPITEGEYAFFLDDTEREIESLPGEDRKPVVNVDWHANA